MSRLPGFRDLGLAPRKVTNRSLRTLATALRVHSLKMVSAARTSHVGSCLSVADILAVLYGAVLEVDPQRPDWHQRDRLIMSKGHAAAVTYAVLAESGFTSLPSLDGYSRNGGTMYGHVTRWANPGVDFSTGSLGHGLPVGVGMALALKRDSEPSRVFVVTSDGEWDEGSNWEAVLFAAHHQLDNVVLVIDYNRIQSLDLVGRTIGLDPIPAKFEAFGWSCSEVDGHDVGSLRAALEAVPRQIGKPTCVVAHTIKGKGVSFMEGQVLWHYRSPDAAELERALSEVRADL